jgi:predicted methyltransferase
MTRTLTALALLGLGFSSCAHAPVTAARSASSIVAAPDRTEADRALDEGRKPVQMLEFLGLQPGMRVGELFAGGGYSTELMARAVAPGGRIYAQNSPVILQKFAEKPWTERLARPTLRDVVRCDRELEDPFPAEAVGLDLVLSNANYHDAVWMKADRRKMNGAVFRSLKPGGAYVIIDSSAATGSGVRDVQSLHRIDEQVIKDEVKAAGFELSTEADFLRNPGDARDWNASPMAAGEKRGQSDRFVLRFVKPTHP